MEMHIDISESHDFVRFRLLALTKPIIDYADYESMIPQSKLLPLHLFTTPLPSLFLYMYLFLFFNRLFFHENFSHRGQSIRPRIGATRIGLMR